MADSLFKQVLDAVKTAIDGLSLSGTPTVTVQKQPWSPNSVAAGITVCPAVEQLGDGTNIRNDVGYGVLVAMCQPSNHDLTTGVETLLKWRQKILRAFHNTTALAAVAYSSAVEPGPVFDWGAFLNQWDTSILIIRVKTREARDTTA